MKANTKSGKLTGLSERSSDMVLVVLCSIFLFLVAYPLYYILIASVSNPYDVYAGKTFLLPSQFTLEGYKAVFADISILTGLLNSLKYTIIGAISCGISAECEKSAGEKMDQYFFHYYHVLWRRDGSHLSGGKTDRID